MNPDSTSAVRNGGQLNPTEYVHGTFETVFPFVVINVLNWVPTLGRVSHSLGRSAKYRVLHASDEELPFNL